MKLTARNTHRDLAYFYLGLIIAFSFSGIFLNHRQQWNPRKYTYESREVLVQLPPPDSINEAFVKTWAKSEGIDDNLRRFAVDKGVLKISFLMHDVTIEVATGEGKIEHYRTTPVLGQMTQLHLDTSKWWIYYSDVFGLAMLTIAITGMFIQKGEHSFWRRGWKLALAGVVFPLIFLFLLS